MKIIKIRNFKGRGLFMKNYLVIKGICVLGCSMAMLTACEKEEAADKFETHVLESYEETVVYKESAVNSEMSGEISVQETFPVEINKEPPISEYDEIILNDERYYLCKKVISGFDQNAVCYGIYDAQLEGWAYDFLELPVGDNDHPDFYYHQEGVFSYSYINSSGNTNNCFLSADYGDYFTCDLETNPQQVRFLNGQAFALLYEKSKNEGGQLTPGNKLYMMSKYGELQEIQIEGFEADQRYYWDEACIYNMHSDEIYARSFRNYISGEKRIYIMVYFYEDGSCLILDDQKYNERLILLIGGKSHEENTNVSLYGDLIRIENLEGDDGNNYYVEYDRSGNLVTDATLMPN